MAYEDDYGPNTSNPQETLSFIWDDYGLSWLQTKMTAFVYNVSPYWDYDVAPTSTSAKLFTSGGDVYTYKGNGETKNEVTFKGGADSDMDGVTLSFNNKMSFGKTETDSGTLVYKEGLETTDTVDDFSLTSKYSWANKYASDSAGSWKGGSKESFKFGGVYTINYEGSESGKWAHDWDANAYEETYTETVKSMKVAGPNGTLLSFSATTAYKYEETYGYEDGYEVWDSNEVITSSSLKNITWVNNGVKIVTKSVTSTEVDLVGALVGDNGLFEGSDVTNPETFIQQAILQAGQIVLDSNNTITLTSKTGRFGEDGAVDAGAGNDSITGGNNTDKIDGGLGADTMSGGKGDDFYYVDNAGDKVKESAKQGNDTVYASIDYTLTSNVENLTLLESGPGRVLGAAQPAAVVGTGNTLANVIVGNSGNNRLDGKAGVDTLTGGEGDDIFVFSTKLGSKNVDTITDFGLGGDVLELKASVFKALGKVAVDGVISEEHLVVDSWDNGAPVASESDDYLLFNTFDNTLYYDANGSSKGGAVAVVTLLGVTDLSIDQIAIV